MTASDIQAQAWGGIELDEDVHALRVLAEAVETVVRGRKGGVLPTES